VPRDFAFRAIWQFEQSEAASVAASVICPFEETIFRSHNTFLKRNGVSLSILQTEDVMVDFASSISFPQSQIKRPRFSATVALSFVASVLVIAIIIFLASKTPGMSPDELASRLSAFP
jgi:hypothetical protein